MKLKQWLSTRGVAILVALVLLCASPHARISGHDPSGGLAEKMQLSFVDGLSQYTETVVWRSEQGYGRSLVGDPERPSVRWMQPAAAVQESTSDDRLVSSTTNDLLVAIERWMDDPIPPALLLIGSALIGLVMVGRKDGS